jgi:archaeosortase C (PEF-CTERM variant)
MFSRVEKLMAWFDSVVPVGTPKRKVLQIVSLILTVEGISVLTLFSYVGMGVGLLSLVIGLLLMFLMYRGSRAALRESGPPGIRFIESIVRLVGGDYVVMIFGALVIMLVLSYNVAVSARPEIGDVDMISLMFGAAVLLYPVLADRFRVEIGFALLFLGFVVAFLVVPQVVMALSGSDGTSSVGNWYVHYMLAAPFAGILDVIGIESSSSGNLVTIQFQSGEIQTLTISAYCAGLYSFSIFLSAFFSFVLVFESMGRKALVAVLLLGLVVAYPGNLFRMVVIGIVGYYRGIEALHWAHENAGWVIFLVWSSAFWYLLLTRFGNREKDVDARAEGN